MVFPAGEARIWPWAFSIQVFHVSVTSQNKEFEVKGAMIETASSALMGGMGEGTLSRQDRQDSCFSLIKLSGLLSYNHTMISV